MRIISGNHRGRTILPDKFFVARPTTDFAKEGLFNILANQIDFETLSVLDLFSGTGSISYEFASRGARNVDAVELDARYASFIVKTAGTLKMSNLRVIRHEVGHFIKICKTQYDIVFADPPYDLKWLPEIPDMILSAGLVSPGGWFILEHPKSVSFADHPALDMHRKYGNVHFSFFLSSRP